MYIPAENVYYEIIVKGDGGEERLPGDLRHGAARDSRVAATACTRYLQVIVLGLRGLQIEKDAREIQ